jgi:Lon protease-like protein
MNSVIPLFPLKLALFPESRYMLHIFEDRYKRMLERVVRENAEFGVVTTETGASFNRIGVYARVAEIVAEYPTGEKDVVATGVERFKCEEYWTHRDGYLEGRVVPYRDRDVGVDPDLELELRLRFERLLKNVEFDLDDRFWRNYDRAPLKSFKVAEKSGLNLRQQMQILAMRREAERIGYLIEHFDSVEELLEKTSHRSKSVMNDGYLP